jgi:hypothetical protein
LGAIERRWSRSSFRLLNVMVTGTPPDLIEVA